MDIYFCSFASESFKRQQPLLKMQLIEIGVAKNKIFSFSPKNLRKNFYGDLPYADETNKFGHYSFKPYVLMMALRKIKLGDLLVYVDVNDCPLVGLLDYIHKVMDRDSTVNILSSSTNYFNIKYTSYFHRERFTRILWLLSSCIFQPEAGVIVFRNTLETRILVKLWYELTMLHSRQMILREDPKSRWDQETLFNLAVINNSIKFESWFLHKLFNIGLKTHIKWEYFRNE